MALFLIIGIAGAIGSGKSFSQLKYAIEYADTRRKQMVFNFNISVVDLHEYCCLPKYSDSLLHTFLADCNYLLKCLVTYVLYRQLPQRRIHKPRYPWVAHLCSTGGLIQILYPKNLEALLIPESVVCLDEAGILLNSREFATTSKKLLADLAQSRKTGTDLIWAAQFEEQVDKQLRLLTQYWVHCDSLSTYDKKLKRPKLFWKRVYWFRAADYQNWLSNLRDRSSHLKARFAYAFKYEGGLLTKSDRLLFKIFDSFNRLDNAHGKDSIVSRYHCKLPRDYYFNRLGFYHVFLDPLSYQYQPLHGIYSRNKSRNKSVTEIKDIVSIDPSNSKSRLIGKALSLCRSKQIRNPPRFSDLSSAQISQFIKSNQ